MMINACSRLSFAVLLCLRRAFIYFLTLLCLALLLICSNGAMAYGFLGHKIVANGAYGHLSPQAQAMVRQILIEGSIADGSVWPDVMKNTGRCEVRFMTQVLKYRQSQGLAVSGAKSKSWLAEKLANSECKDQLTDKLQLRMQKMLSAADVKTAKALHEEFIDNAKDYQFWQASKPWHYVNVPPGQTYQQSAKNPSGDVIVAIETFSAILAGKGDKHPAIMKALAGYLGHLPLQAKQAKMRQFALKFLVHFIGDVHQPLHSGYQADLGGNRINVSWFGESVSLHRVWDTSLLDAQQLTQAQFELLVAKLSDEQKANYVDSSVYDWVAEALELRLKVYDIKRYGGKMSKTYVQEHQAVFNQQLQKASVRLAATLNKILQ